MEAVMLQFLVTTKIAKKITQNVRVRLEGESLEKYESKIAIPNFIEIIRHE